MKRVITVLTFCCLMVSANPTLAATSWDYTADYSTTSNSSLDDWQRGYLTGDAGDFNLYETTQSFSSEIFGWDHESSPDPYGNANINTTSAPYENWGIYWEAGQTSVMPGTAGSWNAVRWVAPTEGTYNISARWTDQRPDGNGTTVAIRTIPSGINSMRFTETTNGFYGRAVNSYSDRTGTNPEAAYSGTMTLAAGQNVDFITEKVPGSLMLGFSATISKNAVMANTIAVPNYSFQSPDVSDHALFPSQVTPSYDAWAISYSLGAGVVLNGTNGRAYANLVGDQCGWMDVTAGAAYVFQDLTGAGATFEVGKAYKLTIGMAKLAFGDADHLMDIALFARTDTGTPAAGSTTVRYGDLSATEMTDYIVNVPVVQSTDAWAGKAIAIWMHDQGGTAGGVWNFDNVRLESVPEPSTLVLLATGLIGLLCYAWRKRR